MYRYRYFVASFTFGVLVWFTMTLFLILQGRLLCWCLPFCHACTQDRVDQLRSLDLESQGSNLTVWFGHYPTSFIVQDPPGIRHIIRLAVMFFSVFFFHPSLINSPWCDLCIWLAIKCQLLQNCWWKTSLMKDQPDEKRPWWHITLI